MLQDGLIPGQPPSDNEFNRIVLETVFWIAFVLTIALLLAGTFH